MASAGPRSFRAAALSGALLLAAGCGPIAQGDAPPAVVEGPRLIDGAIELPSRSAPYLQVVTVDDGPHLASIQAPGRLDIREGAVSRVVAPIGGRVIGVHVRAGDEVSAGQPLLTLHGPEIARLRADRDRALIAVAAARTEWERQARMLDQGIGVASEKYAAEIRLAEEKAALAALEHAVEFIGLAEESRSTAVIKAPGDGTVLRLSAVPGALAEPNGEALVELGDPRALWAVAEVFERDLRLIEPGDEARLLTSGMEKPLQGRVARIGPLVDRQMRRAPVYIELEGTAPALRAGMFVQVVLSRELEGHALPPSAVLLKDRQRHVVYVRTGEHRYEPRDVTVHQTAQGRVHVIDGIDTGDQVVVRGALLLDGTAEQLL